MSSLVSKGPLLDSSIAALRGGHLCYYRMGPWLTLMFSTTNNAADWDLSSCTSESLAAPIIGAVLRYRGKWQKCSDLAPIFAFLIKY